MLLPVEGHRPAEVWVDAYPLGLHPLGVLLVLRRAQSYKTCFLASLKTLVCMWYFYLSFSSVTFSTGTCFAFDTWGNILVILCHVLH